MTAETGRPPLYGAQQSLFARYLERREARRPDPVHRELRRRLLSGLRGRVIEVGSGDGRSFEHYGPGVEAVLAVEPDATARAAALERARSAAVPIEVVDGLAESLPAADGAFDAAVVMGVLCSVPDPPAALEELRRVLAPGGELRFWEHVRSRHVLFRGMQRAFDSLFWTRALGGCETTRDTEATIRAAGFEMVALDRGFHSSSLATITSAPYILGVARPAKEGLAQYRAEPPGRAARPEAASSVAPMLKSIDAPCVLASERPSHPGDEQYQAKPSYRTAGRGVYRPEAMITTVMVRGRATRTTRASSGPRA